MVDDNGVGRYLVTPDDGSAPYPVDVTLNGGVYNATDGLGTTGMADNFEEAIRGLHDGARHNCKRTGDVQTIARL